MTTTGSSDHELPSETTDALPTPYWIHLTAEGVTSLGTRASAVVVPLVLALLTQSAFDLGLGSAAQWLPIAVLGPILGVFADRFDRRFLLVGADIVRLVGFTTLGTLLIFDRLSLSRAVSVLLLIGVAHGVSETAQASLIPALVPSTSLLRANGYIRASETSGRVFGPVLAGLLLVISPGIALIADGITYGVTAVLRWFVLDPERTGQLESTRVPLLRAARSGWATMVESKAALTLVCIASTANVLSATAIISGQHYVFATRDLSVTDVTYAWAMGFGAVIGVGVGLLGSKLDRARWTAAMTIGMLAFGTGIAALGLLGRQAPVPLLFATIGVYVGGFTGVAVLLRSLVQLSVDPGRLGVVFGYLQMATWGAIPLGAILGGAMAELVGTRGNLVVTGGALIALSALIPPLSKHWKNVG